MFEEQVLAREELINKMKAEMLGPGSELGDCDPEHELISSSPEKRYCVGILYPQGNLQKIEDDDTMGEDSGTKEEEEVDADETDEKGKKRDNASEEPSESNVLDEEECIDEKINMANKLLPSSMGMTFISEEKLDELVINVEFGIYRKPLLSECRICLTEKEAEDFEIPEVFNTYFSYDKQTRNLSLIATLGKKQIKYWYDQDKADNGSFTIYAYKLIDTAENGYIREPKKYQVKAYFTKSDYYNPKECIEDSFAQVSALRYQLPNGFYSYTIMLINSKKSKNRTRDDIFQPVLSVNTQDNPKLFFCDYENMKTGEIQYDEELSNALLYRNKKNYGTGLGAALNWSIDEYGKGFIRTDFFPCVEVPQMEFTLDDKYRVSNTVFSMKYLSDLNVSPKMEKINKLEDICRAYSEWIDDLKVIKSKISSQFTKTADRHIDNCSYCLRRMKSGIEVLKDNDKAWDAFQLANRAMYMQRVHTNLQKEFDNVYPGSNPAYEELEDRLEEMDYYKTEDNNSWRPFQIAFLLMCIHSMADDDVNNEDRNIVDLIWFPTGGGKTEAYLGLTAFTIFYRRLNHLETSGGTAVIMRYTLRLLASQQFTRASTLICACEHIRLDSLKNRSKYPRYTLGSDPISIGLWIGGSHTPNKISKAEECYKKLAKAEAKKLKYTKERYNKFQVLKCPWCGTKMEKSLSEDGRKTIGEWGYHVPNGKTCYMSCPNECCTFNRKLPVQVVDEMLYKEPPTLLFATVDKFAMMPWYEEVGGFFANNSNNRTPELIIQDELHLISGPLGSMVGLYETAVDYLSCKKGVKPKIIASTATICRAKEQCSSLYNRNVFQFPPQGMDADDSFFARAADTEKKYGRKYIGLLPAGKTKATMEGKTLASLLQLGNESDKNDDVKDCYWTITAYFNSLKELGKCSTLVQNDVRDNIRRMAHRKRYQFGRRNVLKADELTSRVSTTELNATLEKLEKTKYSSDPDHKTYPSNVLLASNMISVGIDVDRLNVMIMVGQPKLTSEYIQASSRVGRKYPGVVFTLYDGARSRDRSHYEQFKAYHESFYRYVEPTGVTPFSEPARKRALHAVILTMLRQGLPLSSDEALSTFNRNELEDELKEMSAYIINRADEINSRLEYQIKSESIEIDKELDMIYEKIQMLSNQSDHNLVYGNIMGYKPVGDQKRIMKPFGIDEDEPITFDTMTSMRNVDSSVNVNIVEWENKHEKEY
uniref:helicase-related protein n=1 Tax=Eubacterium cellulosolvens TaxID=29322 RepID=UPI0005535BEA|nr:helicase-related protein [[Eubacterium] cellulosolvens]